MMPKTLLKERFYIDLSGPEAEAFLQKVITPDITKADKETARPGALLTPQGKILAEFLIWRDGDDGFRLETSAAAGEDLAKRLILLKLRAKVEISVRNESLTCVYWEADSSPSDHESTVIDGRFAKQKVFRQIHQGDGSAESPRSWNEFRFAHGISECGVDYGSASLFPHEALMDRNGAVSFKKGCFIGQEVVSRMQHRGTARKRLMIVRASEKLPDPGTEIVASSGSCGELMNAQGAIGIGLIRTERAAEAIGTGAQLFAGEIPITIAFPDWAGLSLTKNAEQVQ